MSENEVKVPSLITSSNPREVDESIHNWVNEKTPENASKVKETLDKHKLSKGAILYSNATTNIAERIHLRDQMKHQNT